MLLGETRCVYVAERDGGEALRDKVGSRGGRREATRASWREAIVMKYWRCLARGSALGRIGAADCGLRLKPGTLRLGGWRLWRGGRAASTGYMHLAVREQARRADF